MFARWIINVLISIAIFQAFTFADDLLDQYVRDVGNLIHISNNNSSTLHFRRQKRAVQREMKWTHTEVLDDVGDIILRWQPRHQEIAFKVEARTKGYVGIGFSPNGGMKGADIVVGWVDDATGQPFLLVSVFLNSYFIVNSNISR